MDQWLIRTSQNWIAGPYHKEQVRQMILEGKLTLEDEVCAANSYWIYLHDREEVRQQLDVTVPFFGYESGDDVTETRLVGEDENDTTDPAMTHLGSKETFEEAERRAASRANPENTSVMNRGVIRELRPPKKKSGALQKKGQTPGVASLKGKPSKKGNQAGQKEAFSFWRGLAWALVTIGLLLLSGIFWLLAK